MENYVYKTCKCGAEYTKDEWWKLESVGSHVSDDEHGKLIHMHMRNCANCGSTIAVDHVVDPVQ